MSRQVLQMKYHPAKKVVEFSWENHGLLEPMDDESKLTQYVNKHYPFVLQDHGKEFFDAVTAAYSGELEAPLHVVTTESDYEDFRYMADHYNNDKDSKVKVIPSLIDRLPGMQSTFQAVKEYGETAVGIFGKHRKSFDKAKRDCKFDEVKDYMTNFIQTTERESSNIETKIEELGCDTVNLCFTSVHSAGKSTLINAILGYRILPEAIKAETAKMFCVKSPASGEKARINFETTADVGGEIIGGEIIWSEDEERFIFATGLRETDIRNKVQSVINDNNGLQQQMYAILDELNKDNSVEPKIDVYFPVPLDDRTKGLLKFEIYDTPGTDSDNDEHIKVLIEALSRQSHSILVFVIEPGAIEGSGNASLLEYLKEAESKEKTTIDIGRSLFVANFADKLKDRKQFEDTKDATITNKQNDEFSIKLSDKKLFFTSAMWGYAARASKEHLEDSEAEKEIIDEDYKKMTGFNRGQVYRFNRYANSESATTSMIARSNSEFECASKAGDKEQAALVCSGLFALEDEIINYGEKYASAVRAFAIIEGIERALGSVQISADALAVTNTNSLGEVEKEIECIETALKNAIDDVYKDYELGDQSELSNSLLIDLKLDGKSIKKHFSKPILEKLNWYLGWIFSIFHRPKEDDKKKIAGIIKQVHNNYTSAYNSMRKRHIGIVRDEFLNKIKNAINEKGEISEEAQNLLFDNVGNSEIKPFVDTHRFDYLYDGAKGKIIFDLFDIVKKKEFLAGVDDELTREGIEMRKDYGGEYIKALNEALDTIKREFSDNLNSYSLLLKAKLADRETLETFRVKINALAEDLSNCRDELNRRIWGGK